MKRNKFYGFLIVSVSILSTLFCSQAWSRDLVYQTGGDKFAAPSNSPLPAPNLIKNNGVGSKKIAPEFLDLGKLILLQNNSRMSGGSDSSGGNGVVFSGSRIQLVDFMTNEDLNYAATNALDRQTVNLEFFGQRRFVKRLAVADRNFFACAEEKLEQMRDLPSIQKLLLNLKSVKVMQVEFNIPGLPITNQQQLELGLPIVASESDRLPGELQTALAAYAFNRLWVSARLFSKLSHEHQCGLAVHESLRHLNYISILKKSLSQTEIEIMTRFFMNMSLPQDQLLIVPIIEKMMQTSETSASLAERADEELRLAQAALKSLLAMDDRPDDADKRLAWERRLQKLQAQISEHTARSSKLGAQAIITGLNAPEMKESLKNGLLLGNALDAKLQETLPSDEFWDLLTFSKVKSLPSL